MQRVRLPPTVMRDEGFMSNAGDVAGLKAAYASWLEDIHSDVQLQRKGKRKGRKKRRQELATMHLMQPTESSACKRKGAVEAETAPVVKAKRELLPALTAPSTNNQEMAIPGHAALAKHASYQDWNYNAPFLPGLGFWAKLFEVVQANKSSATSAPITTLEVPAFPLPLPPTLLRIQSGAEASVVLLFTELQGGQQQLPNVTANMFTLCLQQVEISREVVPERRVQQLARFLTNSDASCGVTALWKRASDNQSKTSRVQQLRDASAVADAVKRLLDPRAVEPGVHYQAIQRYVVSKHGRSSGASATTAVCASATKSKGTHAWIARLALVKKDRSSLVWILSHPNNAVASLDSSIDGPSGECQIVKCTNSHAWKDVRLHAETVLRALESCVRVSFKELVVDFIQDVDGQWWLLQVKAFVVLRLVNRPASATTTTTSVSATSTVTAATRAKSAPTHSDTGTPKCSGKFCHDTATSNADENDTATTHGSAGFMNKKDILSCEFYERFHSNQDLSALHGFADFPTALAVYLSQHVSKRERNVFYELQSLCGVCLPQYQRLRLEVQRLDPLTSKITQQQQLQQQRRRKLSSTKSLAALSQRLLPSLQHSPATQSATQLTNPKALSSLNVPASYLDELERIEHVLNEHDELVNRKLSAPSVVDLPSAADKDAKEARAAKIQEELQSLVEPPTPGVYTRLLSQTHGMSRIDDMWASLSLKPLTLTGSQLRATPQCSTASSTTENTSGIAYNSFALSKELATLAKSPHYLAVPAGLEVFYNEALRERLQQDIREHVVDQRRTVRLVILPPTDNDDCDEAATRKFKSEGEMVLRSLYVDVAPMLAQRAPTVAHEPDGSLTLTLVPSA